MLDVVKVHGLAVYLDLKRIRVVPQQRDIAKCCRAKGLVGAVRVLKVAV